MGEVEYLIVGQGIAGTILSYRLIKENKSVLVIDQGHHSSASHVAAGVINPLVLKRLTMTWRAEEFLETAHNFYPELDHHLSISSFHKTPINKLIQSEDEKSFWDKRWERVPLKGVVEKELEDAQLDHTTSPFKKGIVKNTAWVDLKVLLSSYRSFLEKNNLLIEETFDHMDLECHQYKNISFEKIIFCEGASCVSNPFFSHLPFSPNKGELITIKSADLKLNEIYKKKVFVLPLGNDLYRVGATYEREFEKKYDSQQKREELISSFRSIFNCDFEIIDQESGVRPAVMDRRPLLGKHPLINNFFLFNGLGSRGCLMAPQLSEELISLMEDGIPLKSEEDLNRVNRDN